MTDYKNNKFVIPAQAGIQMMKYFPASRGQNQKYILNKSTGFPPARE